MNFQIGKVDLVAGTITDKDGNVTELTLTALINVIIDFINAILRNEEF